MRDRGHKLLVLGSDFGTIDVVKEAKSRGLYVIVADYYESTLAKENADEKWLISTNEIEILVEKCRENGVSAVMTGASDRNITYARELCKRLDLPLYCKSDKAWAVSKNKRMFKDICKEVGARVAEDYEIKGLSDTELDNIPLPVVVKPIDRSGNRGMSYCGSKEELRNAYKYAKENTDNEIVICERQLHGPEYCVNYILNNGDIKLLFYTAEHNQTGERDNLYSLINTTSNNLDQYLDEMNEKVIEVFKRAECREGIAWVETILDEDGHFYLLEMGHRFGGEMIYTWYSKICGFDIIGFMIDIALGKEHPIEFLPKIPHRTREMTASYHLFSKISGEIAEIEGLDEINRMENVIVDIPRGVGKRVAIHSVIGMLRIYCKDCDELCMTIKKINDNLQIKNIKGDNMYIVYDDYEALINEYNNQLADKGKGDGETI